MPSRAPALSRAGVAAFRPGQRLVEIGDDVIDMLDADREPHIAGRDAGPRCSSSVSCECVVEAGWMASERTSPILAT